MWTSSIVQAALLFAVIVLYSSPVVAWAFCPFGKTAETMAICSGLCRMRCYDPNSGTSNSTCRNACTGQYHVSRSLNAADECMQQCDRFTKDKKKQGEGKLERKSCQHKCTNWFFPLNF
ncbi:BQ5605_C007g04881 [Microbotryum silenes-dioicae]|uniref:BQ5605_C007g04881 protein n=1 Tax=Microbotryum silenes-dioicae TaxID=796604 RepID=A0A2X0N2B7_9BASI|nr:BQ5605_C007g04881 [Microbotryum silenes-dioicae]